MSARVIKKIRPEFVRSLATAFAAFVAYGSWAYYANSEYGMWVGFKALLTQGGFSFTLTLIMNLSMEKLFEQTGKVLLTGIPVCLSVYFSAYTVNAFAGTPNILKTMAPGAFISTVYTFSYLLSLKQFAGQQKSSIEKAGLPE